jgi:hypothetical protein
MCAVCWTGAQIIPASAVAARYVWVNHFGGGGRPDIDDTEGEVHDAEEPVHA